jgi:hypothetical protein
MNPPLRDDITLDEPMSQVPIYGRHLATHDHQKSC